MLKNSKVISFATFPNRDLMKKFLYIVICLFVAQQAQSQISLSAEKDTLCVGDSTMIYASNGGAYLWSPNTGLDTISGDTVMAMPSATITYQVIGTVGMSLDTQYITITVNNLPTVSISTAEDTICNGEMTELIASGAQTYTWSPSTGLNTTSGDTVEASPSSASSYEVVGIDSNGCSASASQDLEVLSVPSITLDVPQFVCVGTPTRITASGGSSYAWTPSALFSSPGSDVTLITLNANTTINVDVTGTNGCSSSRGVLVRVNSAPAVLQLEMNDRDTNAVEICEGDTVDLKCVGAGGNGTYDWTGTNLIGNSGITVKANPTVTTVYKIVGNNNGCKDSLNFTINVNPSPTISLSQSSGGAAICKDEADTITVTSDANKFRWMIAGSEVTTTSKIKGIAPGVTSTVVVTAISDESCENSSQIVILVDTSCGQTLSKPELEQFDQLISKRIGNQLEWTLNSKSNEKLQLQLIDITGAVVSESMLSPGESFRSESLNNGIYIVHIEAEGGNRWSHKELIY